MGMLHAILPSMNWSRKLQHVPVDTLISFLKASASHPGQVIDQIASFAGFSVATARKALGILDSLALVAKDDLGAYSCTVAAVSRAIDRESAELVVRRALHGDRRFEAICEGLALGEPESVAVRRAALLLGLSARDEENLVVLLAMGRDLGVLVDTDAGLVLAPGLRSEAGAQDQDLLPEDVESEARARLFNSRVLGRTTNNELDEVERKLLAESLLTFRTDPALATGRSVDALEDFLRDLATEAGYGPEAKKCSGPAQLAAMLTGRGVILTHHQKLVDSCAALRSAGSHSKDKRTLAPWDITEHGALLCHIQSLVALRSIIEFVRNGGQVL